jgi:S-adenosylmethionine/arginine decarboxylase-like enzyme
MPHVIVDVRTRLDAAIARLDDVIPPAEALISNLGLRILDQKYYQHQRGGVSLMFVLSDVHVTVHTFPGERLLCIDVFGVDVNANDVVHLVEELFPCERLQIRAVIDR